MTIHLITRFLSYSTCNINNETLSIISFSKLAANYVISRFQEARRKAGNNGPKLLFRGRPVYALGRVASAKLSAINRPYARGLRAKGSLSLPSYMYVRL